MSSRSLKWTSSLLRCLIDPRSITAALAILFLTTAGWQILARSVGEQFQLGIKALEKNELTSVKSIADWLATVPTYQPHAFYLQAALALREGDVEDRYRTGYCR